MAIRTTREPRGGVVDWLFRPLEWVSALTARFSGMMNQERWTFLLTLIAVVLANLVILGFLLQGQDNRAIAFVILALMAPLTFLIPELSIMVFVSAGAGLFVNAFYFAAGPGGGTGERTLILFFLAVLSARAVYEYFLTPEEQRPRLLSWFTLMILLFWAYYMMHVVYIYVFQYDKVPADSREAALGFYRIGIFRYFNAHMLWIGIVPIIILLRDYQRLKRVLTILGIVLFLSLASLIWEYFAPLPEFWKVVFQLRAAGESQEGYRVREPAAMYLIVAGLFFALYSVGFYRGWRTVIAVLIILFATYAVMVTKNRALWAGILAVLPFALLWKPPTVLLRQVLIGLIALIFASAGMLHPRLNEAGTRIWIETVQRWERNYAYGGDPRNDPSYQARLREKEAWEVKMQKLTTAQLLFGAGLEEPYGRYISLYDAGYTNPRFRNIYIEKVGMHFPWLSRQLHIGWVGTVLLALILVGFFIRATQSFFATHDPLARSMVMGLVGATVSLIAFDMLHSDLFDNTISLPIILLWSVLELIFHWKRTGQLQEPNSEPTPVS